MFLDLTEPICFFFVITLSIDGQFNTVFHTEHRMFVGERSLQLHHETMYIYNFFLNIFQEWKQKNKTYTDNNKCVSETRKKKQSTLVAAILIMTM